MIILFDLDSTLCRIEGLDEVAKWKKIGKEIAEITHNTMSGFMSFEESFPRKIEKLSPSLFDLQRLGKYYKEHYVAGLVDMISQCKTNSIKLGILTANFKEAGDIVSDDLGFEKELRFYNEIKFDESGNYKYFDASQILAKENGKAQIIKNLKSKYKDEKVIFVGDSYGDMLAGKFADQFIGFGGVTVREKVKVESKFFIMDMKELSQVIL